MHSGEARNRRHEGVERLWPCPMRQYGHDQMQSYGTMVMSTAFVCVASRAATRNEAWLRHERSAGKHVTHEMRHDKHVKDTSKQMNSLAAEQVPPSFIPSLFDSRLCFALCIQLFFNATQHQATHTHCL